MAARPGRQRAGPAGCWHGRGGAMPEPSQHRKVRGTAGWVAGAGTAARRRYGWRLDSDNRLWALSILPRDCEGSLR